MLEKNKRLLTCAMPDRVHPSAFHLACEVGKWRVTRAVLDNIVFHNVVDEVAAYPPVSKRSEHLATVLRQVLKQESLHEAEAMLKLGASVHQSISCTDFPGMFSLLHFAAGGK